MSKPRDDAKHHSHPNPTLLHQPNELICERYAVRSRSMPTFVFVSHSGDIPQGERCFGLSASRGWVGMAPHAWRY